MDTVMALMIGALVPLIIGSLFKVILRAIKRRVAIQSPESRVIAKLVPAVNALLDIQGPHSEALIAILEALQGECNGNVKRALDSMREKHEIYNKFLQNAAKVEIVK